MLKKEVALMKRNAIIPRLIVVMPILVMLIIPFVTTLDVKNVGVTEDNSRYGCVRASLCGGLPFQL